MYGIQNYSGVRRTNIFVIYYDRRSLQRKVRRCDVWHLTVRRPILIENYAVQRCAAQNARPSYKQGRILPVLLELVKFSQQGTSIKNNLTVYTQVES